MSTRTPTWHTLAKSIVRPHETLTTAQMLNRAQLSGWNVRKEPVIYPDGIKSLSKDFYVLRDTPAGVESMAIVGDKYQPYQNEEMLAFADNLLDGGANGNLLDFSSRVKLFSARSRLTMKSQSLVLRIRQKPIF